MEKVLVVKNLVKKYSKNLILDNLSLELSKAKVVGILGPNGSGKTTFLKILAGLSRKNSGEVFINGEKISTKTKEFVSYLSDKNFIDNELTIDKILNIYSDFFDFDREKAIRLIEKMNLKKDIKISQFSKGQKEKLFLIMTLSRNAKLYILDEPIAGVDIITREEILNLIIENIYEEATIIVTTHLIKDIEKIFDEVGFIKNGKIEKIYDVEKVRIEDKLTIEDLYKKVFWEEYND